MTDPQTPATEARICICWIDGFPRGTRHQSECDSYNDGRADALREAAERVRALPVWQYDGATWTKDCEHGWDTHEAAVLAILDPQP